MTKSKPKGKPNTLGRRAHKGKLGAHGVVGDGMVIKGGVTSTWGDLQEEENLAGVRTAIVAKKCRNWHGAKGSRKVDVWNRYKWKETYESA